MTALPLSPAILSLEGVVKHFSTAPIPAVNQVNLTLRPGELLGLLGPSGCGKTTLLRLIAGFEQLQSGRIFIGNQEIACPHCTLPPERRGIGMVFQDYALFPHPSQLSGGEQQRVAVARALANRPVLVLADEPTGNLDEATADKVLVEFVKLVRGQGSAALVATHNERLAYSMDRVVRLHDGKLE